MKKKKNQGFTLVELVIAIVILAIAVSPLLANFIQSSKMNLKSRKQLNALNLAQDIMEGMSQYTAQENADYFFLASVSDNSILADARVLPSGTTVTSCSGKVATKSSPTLSNISSPMPTDWSKFVFEVKGVQTATGNYNNYDMTITIDSTSVSTNVDAGNKTPQEIAESINGKEYANISQVDLYFDAVHTINSSEELNAYDNLRQNSNYPDKDLSEYKGKVNRTINVNIANKGTVASPKYEIEVVNEYKVLDGEKDGLGFKDAHVNDNVYYDRSANLNNAEEYIMPRSIYLYYEGLSNVSKNSANKEIIKINNTTNQPITVYLVRIVDEATLNDATVQTYNSDYKCDVYVNSKESDAMSAPTVDNVDIVSNLRFNLAYDNGNKRVYEEGTANTKLPGITDAEATASKYKRERSLIYYNNTVAIGESGNTQGNDFYETHIFDGYRKLQKDVLYDVNIEIRENGQSRTIASYTGGLSN